VSAYIVNTDLIDLLVTAGLRGNGDEARLRVFHYGKVLEFNRYEDANHVGQILLDANADSVGHRYTENITTSWYEYNGAGITEYLGGPVIPWGHVLGALRCYEYQSCENTSVWPTSLAKEIIDAIRLKVCRIITEEAGGMWEWSRDDAREIMEDIKQKVRS
jgi:hypothetical protein